MNAVNPYTGALVKLRSAVKSERGILEHDPAISDQPLDEHARENKRLERDASGEADSNRSHPALARQNRPDAQRERPNRCDAANIQPDEPH
jgi:hypothetical protein